MNYRNENQGIVIVVFKDSAHVKITLNELNLVKSKLTGKAHFDDVNIQNW